MKYIAYFTPKGEHDPNEYLGLGWGPRTVFTDGTHVPWDARDTVTAENLKEIDERLKKLEASQGPESNAHR